MKKISIFCIVLLFCVIFANSLKSVNYLESKEDYPNNAFCNSDFMPDRDEYYNQNCTYGCSASFHYISYPVSCEDDSWKTAGIKHQKKEGGSTHTQNPRTQVQTCYHIYKSANVPFAEHYVIIHQRIIASVGEMIVNNPTEHVAFFNTQVKLENSILDCEGCRFEFYSPTTENSEHEKSQTTTTTRGLKLSLSGGGDLKGPKGSVGFGFSKENSNSITIKNNIKDWSMTDTTFNNTKSWLFYQTYPFNALTSNPRNFGTWFRKSLDGDFDENLVTSKMVMLPLSQLSSAEFKSDIITVISVPKDNHGVRIHTRYSQFLGNIVTGSHFIDSMRYREYEYYSTFIKDIDGL